MTRTAFIPDLTGHAAVWRSISGILDTQDVDRIIQLGNIIGCNDIMKDASDTGINQYENRNGYVLNEILVERRGTLQDNLITLIGENEIAALNFPYEWTNVESVSLIREAWLGENPTLFVAAAEKNRLVTHGGLTYGEWLSIGAPGTPVEAAGRLNEKYSGSIYQGGCAKLGDPPNFAANPIWADVMSETAPSWVTAPVACPFDQITAGGANNDRGREYVNSVFSPVHLADKVRYPTTGSVIVVKGSEIIGIDLNLPREDIKNIPRPYRLYVEETTD